MGVFKKTVFLLVIGIALSLGLYSCSISYGTCGDVKDIPTALVDISDLINVTIFETRFNEEIPIGRSQYGGFYTEWETQTLAYEQWQKPFSLFPSAYALSCDEPDIYLKEVYPTEVKIITLNDLDENTQAGSLANQYFILPFNTINAEKTQFDIEDVKRSRFDTYSEKFYLKFKMNSLTPYEADIQFRIEITLNNGEIIIRETSIVKTR